MMEPSPTASQLSTCLQPTKKPDTNIELAISALTHHFESQLRKRKESPGSAADDDMASLLRNGKFDLIQEGRGAQPSHLTPYERYAFASRPSDDTPDRGSPAYFAGDLSPTTPRRERTSRYLSEGARKEIIARIDGGEKQVALAKEFNVSRAAICNLYKKRWEVLNRGVRDPTATHPKKSRKKSSTGQTAPAATTTHSSPIAAVQTSVYSNVPPMPTQANASRSPRFDSTETPSPLQSRQSESYQGEYQSWPGAQDRPNQLRHRNLLQDGVNLRPRDLKTHHGMAVDCPGMPEQFLVHEASAYSYPCRNLVATLRDESISTVVFQQRVMRLARLLIEDVLTCLPHAEEEITNAYGDLCHTTKALDGGDFCAVSMEDKGMVLLRAFSDISPASPTGVVSIEKRSAESSGASRHISAQLPSINDEQSVLLLDIECAVGEKACAVLHHLVHYRQIPARNIYLVTVVSAFEGLQNVFRHFPDVSLVTAQVDTVLDDQQRIRPGIGDFVHRYWNVSSPSSNVPWLQ
ncbi:hypothetical protein PHYPSEUDO_001261 [Phytophthora pseudosyringae]|uniref:Phosphoribosyltransferase domain-containing protein n=1 Tax=Phytophthora pseudosyringae TaxID=221518 RepID=A0A8T1W086_9STRA|nr:hypothetical protein PHYPSEUDO_001261 [Phytophthora pseudosyringae]